MKKPRHRFFRIDTGAMPSDQESEGRLASAPRNLDTHLHPDREHAEAAAPLAAAPAVAVEPRLAEVADAEAVNAHAKRIGARVQAVERGTLARALEVRED